MSTPTQILALCLAFLGSLIIGVASARVILEVIVGLMRRGLPTPQHRLDTGALVLADFE